MAMYKPEEIIGIWVNEELLCIDCCNFDNAKQDDLLLTLDVEKSDDLYFCDKCGKRIY